MTQPESTERCATCGREKEGMYDPAHWTAGQNPWNAPDCLRIGYERVSRSLAEAEKAKLNLVASLNARTEALAEAEKERDEARDTIKTIAVMLGWGNVPPREVLERSLNANRERIRAAEERAAALEKDLEYERVSQRAAYKKVVAEAEAAEERAAQAERVLRVIFDTTGCVCEDEHREFCPVGIASVALQEAAKGRAPQAPPDSVAGGGAQGEEK